MAGVAALQSSMAGLGVTGFMGSRIFSDDSMRLQLPSRTPAPLPGPLVVRAIKKRWEKKELKPNGLPVRQKMHVLVGDTVQVISGHEHNKIGEVTQVFSHNSSVVVKDVNLKTKFVKPRREGETGQIILVEGAIHSSNVMLYSKEQKVRSRVGHKFLENGSKVRYLLKTGEVLDTSRVLYQKQKDAAIDKS